MCATNSMLPVLTKSCSFVSNQYGRLMGVFLFFILYIDNNFSVFVADASVTVHANRYLEKTSMAVWIFTYLRLEVQAVTKRFAMRSHSGRLSRSGVIDGLKIRLS